jgi:hypothetical protein
MITSDADLNEMVRQELILGWHAEAALAKARQVRIAQANERLANAAIEGIGQRVMSMDLFSYLDWERREPGITRDADWRRRMMRDNPETRVRYTPRKAVVSVPDKHWQAASGRWENGRATAGMAEASGICP